VNLEQIFVTVLNTGIYLFLFEHPDPLKCSSGSATLDLSVYQGISLGNTSLQELKAWCAQRLAASVTNTNYSELLRMAELYSVKLLHAAVLKYIASNVDQLTS
jgi:hypothetical protein